MAAFIGAKSKKEKRHKGEKKHKKEKKHKENKDRREGQLQRDTTDRDADGRAAGARHRHNAPPSDSHSYGRRSPDVRERGHDRGIRQGRR